MSHTFIKKTTANLTSPEEIDVSLKKSLLAYLNGEVTQEHLTRMLKKQLHGNSTRLSFKVVDLLPQFNQLLDLLENEKAKGNPDKKMLDYVLKKLANTLYDEFTS